MKTDELIRSVELKAALPISRVTWTQEDILSAATEEVKLSILPSVRAAKEDYLLHEVSIPIIPGRTEYSIPYRASGGSLRDVAYSPTPGSFQRLTRASIDERGVDNGAFSQFFRFYVKNNQIVLMGTQPPTSGNIVMVFYMMPSKLVLPSRCAFINTILRDTDINGNADTTKVTFVCDTFPANIATVGAKLDVLEGKPIYRTFNYDVIPTASDSTTRRIEFLKSSIDVDFVDVGSYIASAQECCIPQIPEELHTLLSHEVAARALESLGDQAGLGNVNAKIAKYETGVYEIIGDRAEGTPKKIVNRNQFLNGIRRLR